MGSVQHGAHGGGCKRVSVWDESKHTSRSDIGLEGWGGDSTTPAQGRPYVLCWWGLLCKREGEASPLEVYIQLYPPFWGF